MADNLCGPSNALQNFQKHSTVDRTLQQDRLVHRPSPSQGFRSSPGPNAGLLDPEFEAFQAGRFPLESQSFQPQGFSYAPPPQQAGPSWANDFQQLNISGPHHQLQQQPLGQQAQPRHDTAGWHQDFAQQFAGLGKSVASDPRSAQMAGRSVPMYMQQNNGVSMYQNSFQPQQSAMAQQDQRAEELFDEEAFERAFQEAAESEQELTQKEQIELGQDIMIAESVDRLVNDQPPVDQVRLGADLIHDPSSESRNSPQEQEDPDALARTAAQLLDSVRHNQSNKFQNSQFLELMRQLRDREVMVEGDKIVGGGSSNGTTTGWDMEMMSDEAVKEELRLLSATLNFHQYNLTPPYSKTTSISTSTEHDSDHSATSRLLFLQALLQTYFLLSHMTSDMIWKPEHNFDRGFASSIDGGDSLYDLFDAIARGFECGGGAWQNGHGGKGLVRDLVGYLVVTLERIGMEKGAEKGFGEVYDSYMNDSRKREKQWMRAVHDALGQIVPPTSLSSSSSTSYPSLASSFNRSSFIREHGNDPGPEKLFGVLPYELKGDIKGDSEKEEWHLELAKEILEVKSSGGEEREGRGVVGKDGYEMGSPKEMRDLAEEIGRTR